MRSRGDGGIRRISTTIRLMLRVYSSFLDTGASVAEYWYRHMPICALSFEWINRVD